MRSSLPISGGDRVFEGSIPRKDSKSKKWSRDQTQVLQHYYEASLSDVQILREYKSMMVPGNMIRVACGWWITYSTLLVYAMYS